MVRGKTVLVAVALVGACVLWTTAGARAQSTASPPDEAATLEARAHFEEGVRLSRAERWLEALDAFRQSRQRIERPRTLFNMAIALDRLGRLRESIAAIDRFLEISDPTADEADRREAARMRLACERRLVTLTLRVAPPDAIVELDGAAVPGEGAERQLTWDPGDHVLVVRAAGHAQLREALSLPPGSLVDRTVTLTPDASVAVTTIPGDVSGPGRIDTPAGDTGPADTGPAETGQTPGQTSIVEEPVFWIVLGVVVVGLGVGVGVGVQVATEPQPYGGTTGLRF